ncbi:LamG domain-containing protein [Flavobacterium caeni]|uniref:Concanavalin A-like lectin/glucanases superfamily protein n=1 Tax=Flavobacterium caeni TaxID=490189 RepID=A0A1G5FT12_9FLAO|nr:LamG domain-containing protein [Flavobacterium caeni]SCY42321.1 Concanavalin A-like lectin/glucanases superfamily protein [Flavobacterium caeni]
MISKLKWVLVCSVVAVLFSCQDESRSSYVSDQALDKAAPLSNKLHRVALAIAPNDNVVDSASCFKVKLPVQVAVNGTSMLIEQPEDYREVADLLAVPGNHPDPIAFQYPITITYDNGNQLTVSSDDQLDQLRQQCPTDASMTPIKCINAGYPFSISLYDPVSQTPQIMNISDGSVLLAFFENLTSEQFYQINYPITLVEGEGFTQQITNNAALQSFIDTFGDQCSSCDNQGILIDNDLILYIPFANEVADLTGFSTPVVPDQGVGFVADRSGNPNAAFSFLSAGTNTLQINATAQNNWLQSDGFTISLWFNRQNPQVFDFERLLVNEQFELSLGNQFNQEIRSPFVLATGLSTPLYDTGWVQGGMLGELNQWHHLVVVYNGETLYLYRDGVLQSTTAMVEFSGSMLGGGVLGQNFRGYLDDIRMYKRALNQQEIDTLFSMDGDANTCMD